MYMRERERENFCVVEMDVYWMVKPENHVIDGGEIQAVQCNFMKSPFPLEMRGKDTLTLYSALTSYYDKIAHASTRHSSYSLLCW